MGWAVVFALRHSRCPFLLPVADLGVNMGRNLDSEICLLEDFGGRFF